MRRSTQDHTLAARVAVRVLDGSGDAVGAGFLIGPDLVATCAHVVATAVGSDAYAPDAPPGEVRLDFPLLGGPATATVHRWLPIAGDGSGDIAVLQLLGQAPADARMPPLRRIDQLWDHRFRVLGFPHGLVDGVWSTGRIRGAQGTRWYQLQTSVGDQPIVQGFSGAPVWHEETGAVVGMTVASDRSGETTTAYLVPVEQILGVDPELLPCPYRGLEPFDEEHAEFFFGREHEIAHLVDAVAAHPLVAVAGPSGAGKSSLVRAGLLPRLRAQGRRTALLRPVPGQPTESGLAAALDGAGSDVVLVVDQFEELAATEPQAAQELLERIGELVRGPASIKAVLTLRSATLDEILVPRVAGLLNAGTVFLPPMERDQLRDAIVAPAERAPGLSFEIGLVDRILDDAAAEPGRLPLVESLLTELWNRRDGGYLTLDAYEQAGGVAGVVATHAETVVAGFTEPDDEAALRRVFTALAAPDSEGRFVRTALPWADVDPGLRPLVQRLAAGRLIVIERSATGAEHVQLAHQALIAHWPRLRSWLTEDRDFLAWRAQLEQQRERWEAAARDDEALLRGTALSTAQDWLPARGADMSAANHEYVRRSRARQRREVRRWRVVTAILAVLVLAAGTLAVVAINSRSQIGDQLRLANAELVAQLALTRSGSDPVVATQLALTAWRLDPNNAAARTALARQYLAMRSVEAVFAGLTSTPIGAIAVSDRTPRALLRDGPGLAVFDGLETGEPRRWDVPTPESYQIASFLENDRLAVVEPDGDVLTWDLATHTGPARVPAGVHGTEGITLVLAPDGTRLAWLRTVAPGVHGLEVRDARTGAVVPHNISPIPSPHKVKVDLTADPSVVFIQLGDSPQPRGPLTLRSLIDGAELRSFPPGSVPTWSGDVVSCEQEGDASVAVLRNAERGDELRRIPLVGRCSAEQPLKLTLDANYLMEFQPSPGVPDFRSARLTRLTDGRSYQVVMAPHTQSSLDTDVQIPVAVLPGDADAITVLAARGTSLMRMRGDPAPTDTRMALWPTGDDRYHVGTNETGMTVFDRELRRIAEQPAEQVDLDGNAFVQVSRGLATLVRRPTGWTASEFSVPSLARTHLHDLPGSEGADAASIEVLPDRIIGSANGVITTWDRSSGRQLYQPTHLAGTTRHRFAVRPGHPDEVVVAAPIAGLEMWSLAEQRRIAEFPVIDTFAPIAFAFDTSGDRIVSLTLGPGLEIRDVSTQRLVRPTFPAPAAVLLYGVTRDGHVVTLQAGEDHRVGFWDIDRGRDSGLVVLPKVHRTYEVSDDGLRMPIPADNGALPFVFPVTAQQWFDGLCAVSDRPFTESEKALIPAGTGLEQPCAT